MEIYRSKNKINTGEQFVFTCDVALPEQYSIGFMLHNAEINPDEIATLPAVRKYESNISVLVDNTNNILLDDGYSKVQNEPNLIKKKKSIKEDEVFTFFNSKCVLHDGKIYEQIYKLEKSDIDVYDLNGDVFSYNNKFIVMDIKGKPHAAIDVEKNPVISVFSYIKGKPSVTKYITDGVNNFKQIDKLKLTISNSGELKAYFEKGNNVIDFNSYSFNYPKKNTNYLYILVDGENQNILSNAAVSGLVSNVTSPSIA